MEFSSKLLALDDFHKTGTLEYPKGLRTERMTWHFGTDAMSWTECKEEISSLLDALQIGDSMNYFDPKRSTTFTVKMLSAVTATRTSGHSGATEPMEKRLSSSSVIAFKFGDCAIDGAEVSELMRGCVLRYNVIENGNAGPYQAVNVRIPFLCHRWQRFDAAQRRWRALSRAESVDLEDRFNPKHGAMDGAISTENGDRIRRMARFKGMVLSVDQGARRGAVQMNYPEEYGPRMGLPFAFRDCQFNASALRVGDEVEYNVDGDRAVNVKLWLIPYRWQFMRKRDAELLRWNDFSYHECTVT